MSEPLDRYAPPLSDLGTAARAESPLSFALAVFTQHRLALLITLIWLPGNLAIEFGLTLVDPDDLVAASSIPYVPSLLLHALCIGIVCEACRRFSAGHGSVFSDLCSAGLRSWRRVFVANFIAQLIYFAGFIAFVIPGLVLFVRYAFVEIVAAREDLGAGAARVRSRELVTGRAWRVAAVVGGFSSAMLAALVAHSAASGFVPQLEHFALRGVFDTGVDVVHLAMFAALHALYEEAGGTPQPLTPGASA